MVKIVLNFFSGKFPSVFFFPPFIHKSFRFIPKGIVIDFIFPFCHIRALGDSFA